MTISSHFSENLSRFQKIFRTDKNFDVVYHVMTIGERQGAIFFIDGFAKDDTMSRILQFFLKTRGYS